MLRCIAFICFIFVPYYNISMLFYKYYYNFFILILCQCTIYIDLYTRHHSHY
jgi:uncharacterized membrane protein